MQKQCSDESAHCNSDPSTTQEIKCLPAANSQKKTKRPDKPLYIPPKGKSISSNSREKDKIKSMNNNNLKANSSLGNSDELLDWDSLYDEKGDVINSEFVNDLNKDLNIEAVSEQMAKSHLDYSKFNNQFDEADNPMECGNILEVYDFSSDLKTCDLVKCFSLNFKNFDIDWVDETHALVIFNSSNQAINALQNVYPILKLRPLSEGIRESQLKAKRRIEKGPTKPRPETTTFLARRLVIGALGLKADKNNEQQKAEREKLRLAKEKKKLVKKQVNDIWNENTP